MPKGYIADGSGNGAAYGRCPDTGLAYKRDGTVRKARTVKTVEEQMAGLAEMERKAHGTMGKKILAAMSGFDAFLGAFGKFKAWVREAKAHATEEATAARREALERQLEALEAKQDAAQAFLSEQGEAIEQANGVFAKVGAGYLAFSKANGRPPNAEEGSAIVAEVVDSEAIEAVVGATDPANDPFLAFRRETVEADSDDSDDDSL